MPTVNITTPRPINAGSTWNVSKSRPDVDGSHGSRQCSHHTSLRPAPMCNGHDQNISGSQYDAIYGLPAAIVAIPVTKIPFPPSVRQSDLTPWVWDPYVFYEGTNMRRVYLDNNATTQMAPEVIEAIQESFQFYGNASSMHEFGREAISGIEAARSSVAAMIGATPGEIIFTSGGSESDNSVFAQARDMIDAGSKRNRIITSTIEHPAIIETCRYLVKNGYHVDYAS